MTIVVHRTEASRLAHEVSKLNVPEIHEFVDILKKLENIANTSGYGNHNFSAVKQRINFNDYLEQQNG